MKKLRGRTLPVSEDDVQKAVAQHLRLRALPGTFWFHPPNGGSRNIVEAKKLKAMGVQPGVGDVVIIRKGATYMLELKTMKGRISTNQKLAQQLVRAAGGHYEIVRGIDAALDQLVAWGVIQGAQPVR